MQAKEMIHQFSSTLTSFCFAFRLSGRLEEAYDAHLQT